MMTHWILIIWFVGQSGSIEHINFNDEKACEIALHQWVGSYGSNNLSGICTPESTTNNDIRIK